MFRFVASEGYPTVEAIRNNLVRDGQIVIELPEGVKVIEAKCDDPSAKVSVEGNEITTRIGHSWCTISIHYRSVRGDELISFHPQKLNNWNRILFRPKDARDPDSDYLKYENGVEESYQDVQREIIVEQEVRADTAPHAVDHSRPASCWGFSPFGDCLSGGNTLTLAGENYS